MPCSLMISLADEIGIRFSKSVLKGYILILDSMLEDLNSVAKLLDESCDYVMTLEPK